MDFIDLLPNIELFRGLSPQQIEKIHHISHTEVYHNGDIICQQGDDSDRMFIIGTGQVEVRVQTRNGQTYSPLYLGTGQIVGEMGLIDASKRSATIIAADDETIIYSLAGDDFTALCQSDTAIGYLMMRNLAQDLSFKLRHQNPDSGDAS